MPGSGTGTLSVMGDESGRLDFSEAHYEQGTEEGLRCSICGLAPGDEYFEINRAPACASCRAEIAKLDDPAGRFGRVARATAMGAAGGALGAALWYAVAALFKLEIGLIAIAVGWLVGSGVRRGSGGRGGRGYQVLAAFIAYASIVTTYIPDIYREFASSAAATEGASTAAAGASGGASPADRATPAAPPKAESGSPALGPLAAVTALGLGVVLLYAVAFAAPFLGGLQNAIGLLIIFFALQQAWSLNRKPVFEVQGPFRVSRRTQEERKPEADPA